MDDKRIFIIKLIFRILTFISILGILFIIFLVIKDKQRKIYKFDVKIKNEEIIDLTKKERKECIKQLIKYLNSEKYYICNSIVFYENTFDNKNNAKYFYVLVKGNDKSLIEITKEDSDEYNFEYIGNELTPHSVSSKTGVSYLQIVNPKKYKKEQEEEKNKMKIDSGTKKYINEW